MMFNSLNVLLENSIFSKLLCDTDSCLSYIIILLDILSVFYLVFCSYYKITKRVRLIGYIWSAILLCSTVIIMFFHTCIFTITGVVFTIMIEMAMLSVVFNHDKSSENNTSIEKTNENKKKNVGCYVIFPTNDNNFVFGLHNKKNELLAMSTYKYSSVEEAKDAINLSKTSGNNCEFEDLTKNWVADAKHPKFSMYLKKQKFFFELAVNNTLTILKSDAIDEATDCLKMVKDARVCVTSNTLYFATSKEDVKNGKRFPLFNLDEKSIKEVNEERHNEISTTEETDLGEAKSLAESLKEIENVKTSHNINKQTLFEYLNGEYGKKVILNRRENQTKTGLPLADTYYTYYMNKQENGKETKKKICFAYVYENNGACLILAKLDKSFANSLKKSKKSIMPSKFPKSKLNDWYSVIVNDTFTEDEIYNILEKSKEYCEGNK